MPNRPRALTLPYQVPVVWSPQAAYAIQKDFESILQLLQAAGIAVNTVTPSTPGLPGADGAPGLAIHGLDGEPGDRGEDSLIPGPPGPPGATGPAGSGSSGGATAPVFLEGEPGEAGEDSVIPGPPGSQGAAGTPGAAGSAGASMPFAPVTVDDADVGDPEAYISALGGGNSVQQIINQVINNVGGGGLITSTFNPQGLVLANIGQFCGDAVNLRVYQKVAGQSTKTGWYPIESPGYQANPTVPVPWYHTLSGVQAIAGGAIRGNGYGYFSAGPGDSADSFAISGFAATSTEIYVNGKRYGRFEPAATSGTSAYMAIGAGTPGLNPRKILDDDIDIWVDMRTDPTAVTTVRYWFGLTSANLTDTDTLGSAANGSIMFRFSTAAGDGGWVGATQLNGGANQTVTATILAIAAATNYRLRIRFVRTGTPTVYFSVNDGVETAVTTNIPATGSTYFPIFGLTTKANVTRSILWRSFGASVGS